MSPVSEANLFREKNTGFLIKSCHKTAAVIEKSDESDDGVFLLLFLS